MIDDQMSPEGGMDDAKVFAEFLKKPTTLPEQLVITLTNFADEQDAQRCGDVVRNYLSLFGRFMDLSRLDHVYVTFDYAGTLASLDIGTGSDTVLSPTNDEVATGVAMAPSVLRNGAWKSVIVINAEYARSLSYEIKESDTITEEQLQALRTETIHILAHECGHVHDHAMQTTHLPPVTYSRKWTRLEHRLKEPAATCWSEYIAEYMSAGFGTATSLQNYENSFRARLRNAWPAITASIRQYRMHGNVDRVIAEVGQQIRFVLVYAAYMLGSIENKKHTLEEAAPDAVQVSRDCPELGSFLSKIYDELLALHDQYPNFTSLDVFTPLSEVVHAMYQQAGLTFVEVSPEELRVEIPHRADTMPSLTEQMAYRFKQAGLG